MTTVAISYRKEDSGIAKSIFYHLVERLGSNEVFLAESSIPDGRMWEDEIRTAFKNARMVIAIVGKNWIRDDSGTFRLDSDDWVHKELEIAFHYACPAFIPVLVDGATRPSDLDLRQAGAAAINLFRYQAVTISSATSSEIRILCCNLVSQVMGVHATFSHFPVSHVQNSVMRAENRVLVWHTWTEYFRSILKASLTNFLRKRWEQQEPCSCQILLASKENVCAAKRALAVRGSSLKDLFNRTIFDLDRIAREIVPDDRFDEILEVKFYDSFPSMPLYVADDVAYLGWYPPTAHSHDSPYVQVCGRTSLLLGNLEKLFQIEWSRARSKWDFAANKVVATTSESSRFGGLPGGM